MPVREATPYEIQRWSRMNEMPDHVAAIQTGMTNDAAAMQTQAPTPVVTNSDIYGKNAPVFTGHNMAGLGVNAIQGTMGTMAGPVGNVNPVLPWSRGFGKGPYSMSGVAAGMRDAAIAAKWPLIEGVATAADRAFPNSPNAQSVAQTGGIMATVAGPSLMKRYLPRQSAQFASWMSKAIRPVAPVVRPLQAALRGAGRVAGPTMVGAAHLSQALRPMQDIRQAEEARAEAIQNSFQGTRTGARLGRIGTNLLYNLEKGADVFGSVYGAKGSPAAILANGSLTRMGKQYADIYGDHFKALTGDRNARQRAQFMNQIYSNYSGWDRLGGGTVGGRMLEQKAFQRQINPEVRADGTRSGAGWDQSRFNNWRNSLRRQGVPERDILRQAETIRRDTPLYFHKGVTDQQRRRSTSDHLAEGLRQTKARQN